MQPPKWYAQFWETPKGPYRSLCSLKILSTESLACQRPNPKTQKSKTQKPETPNPQIPKARRLRRSPTTKASKITRPFSKIPVTFDFGGILKTSGDPPFDIYPSGFLHECHLLGLHQALADFHELRAGVIA